MADLLQRLAERTLGVPLGVQPALASPFAPYRADAAPRESHAAPGDAVSRFSDDATGTPWLAAAVGPARPADQPVPGAHRAAGVEPVAPRLAVARTPFWERFEVIASGSQPGSLYAGMTQALAAEGEPAPLVERSSDLRSSLGVAPPQDWLEPTGDIGAIARAGVEAQVLAQQPVAGPAAAGVLAASDAIDEAAIASEVFQRLASAQGRLESSRIAGPSDSATPEAARASPVLVPGGRSLRVATEPRVAPPASAELPHVRAEQPAATPVIYVSIGRVEVRAVHAPASASPAQAPQLQRRSPVMTLEAYLQTARGGSHE